MRMPCLGTADIDSTLQMMSDLLAHLSAEELRKPAVVSLPAIHFNGFEDNITGSRMLINSNPAYFDSALTADIDRQLNDKFNFKKLQDMLGK